MPSPAPLGLGVAVASVWMCAEELASGALVEVLTEYTLDPVTAFVGSQPAVGVPRRRESSPTISSRR